MVFFVGHCFGPLWDRVQNVSVNSKIRCIRASSALLFLCFIEFAVFLLSKHRMNCEIHREKYTKLSITLHIYTSSWQRFRLKVCNWQSFASRKLWWHFVGSVPFRFISFGLIQGKTLLSHLVCLHFRLEMYLIAKFMHVSYCIAANIIVVVARATLSFPT